jgi:hypothetical protein
MKKILSILVAVLLTAVVSAQVPQKMDYQCVIRNTGGALVANHNVGIRISILQGSATGTVVYRETYSPIPVTDANGLVTIEIGGGTPVTGTFAAIDWSAGPYYLKTETDPAGGTSYSITGTSQLLSVPYAQFAKTAENGTLWSESGSNIYFNTGKIGVGTTTPPYVLSVYAPTVADVSVINSFSGSTTNDGLRVGLGNDGNAWVWNNENAELYFGTNNVKRMTIMPNGRVNIGTGSADATLTVNGTVKVGTSGKIFSEIIEVTGTTNGTSSYYASFAYPTGYTRLNTRVLSAEINGSGDVWLGLGFTNGTTAAVPISYNLSTTSIYIFYPDMGAFQSKPFRMVLMKVE